MTFERWMEEVTKGGVTMSERVEEDSSRPPDKVGDQREEEEAKMLRLRKAWFGY